MTSYSITDARRDFAAMLNEVADEKKPVLLTRHDKPVVAIIPLEDFELLQKLRAEAAATPQEPPKPKWEKTLLWEPLEPRPGDRG